SGCPCLVLLARCSSRPPIGGCARLQSVCSDSIMAAERRRANGRSYSELGQLQLYECPGPDADTRHAHGYQVEPMPFMGVERHKREAYGSFSFREYWTDAGDTAATRVRRG